MRCACAACQAAYDRRYLRRIDRGWPRWIAFLAGPPGSKNAAEARKFVVEYDRAWAEGRIGVGLLGAVITSDSRTASEITRTFGMGVGHA
jgi:hypothetical protein